MSDSWSGCVPWGIRSPKEMPGIFEREWMPQGACPRARSAYADPGSRSSVVRSCSQLIPRTRCSSSTSGMKTYVAPGDTVGRSDAVAVVHEDVGEARNEIPGPVGEQKRRAGCGREHPRFRRLGHPRSNEAMEARDSRAVASSRGGFPSLCGSLVGSVGAATDSVARPLATHSVAPRRATSAASATARSEVSTRKGPARPPQLASQVGSHASTIAKAATPITAPATRLRPFLKP